MMGPQPSSVFAPAFSMPVPVGAGGFVTTSPCSSVTFSPFSSVTGVPGTGCSTVEVGSFVPEVPAFDSVQDTAQTRTQRMREIAKSVFFIVFFSLYKK
ncbi:MAG: hypothetical protein IJV68_06615 [Clostridia bacterium]|nr:hypothetical protein [Clostridia bacterium]